MQALSLTAIVITFAVTAFLLALAARSWQLTGDDTVRDDLEDARVRRPPATTTCRTPAPRSASPPRRPRADGGGS